MEATSVTGPAKNLIGFCRWAHSPEGAGARLRLSIATYCRGDDEGRGNGFVVAARAAGIDTYTIRERRAFDPGVYPQLARIVTAVAPDVVQTHNVKSHFLLKSSGLHGSRVWLAFQHGYQSTDLKLRLYNQLDRWTLRSADLVVSVCEAFAARLIAYGVRRDRIRILHNAAVPPTAVQDADKDGLRRALGIGADEAVMVTIGRMSKEKGHVDLLTALGYLPASVRPWKAIVVGDGPDHAKLVAHAQRSGIEDRVIFAGFQRDVRPFYAIADAFVLPSHSEGSSNVILEAMSWRIPIAATAVGGTPEILTNGDTALLTPGGDPEALARSLARLLTDRQLGASLAAAASARVASAFSPDRYRQTLAGIYMDALTGHIQSRV